MGDPEVPQYDRNRYIGEVLSGGSRELIHGTTQYMFSYGWGRAEAEYGRRSHVVNWKVHITREP